MIYSPHIYENPFNSMLNLVFIELIKNAICKEKCLKGRFQSWKLKQTIYGILVSKLIILLRIIKLYILYSIFSHSIYYYLNLKMLNSKELF